MQHINLTTSRFQLYVEEYNELAKALILLAVFDDLDLIEVDPFGMLPAFQEMLAQMYRVLIETEIAVELADGAQLPGLDGATVTLQSDYVLDYVQPVGLIPPAFRDLWENCFQYQTIRLVYRWKNTPPTQITPLPEWAPAQIDQNSSLLLWLPRTPEAYDATWQTQRSIHLANAEKIYYSLEAANAHSTNPDHYGVFVNIHPLMSQFIDAAPGRFGVFEAEFNPWKFWIPMTEDDLTSCWELLWPEKADAFASSDAVFAYVSQLFEHPALDLFETEDHAAGVYHKIATPGYFSFGWDPDWQQAINTEDIVFPAWHDKWITMRDRLPDYPGGYLDTDETCTRTFLARLYYLADHNFRKYWLYWDSFNSRIKWIWSDFHGEDLSEFDPYATEVYGAVDSPQVKPEDINYGWMYYVISGNGHVDNERYPIILPSSKPAFMTNLIGATLAASLGMCVMDTAAGRRRRQ